MRSRWVKGTMRFLGWFDCPKKIVTKKTAQNSPKLTIRSKNGHITLFFQITLITKEVWSTNRCVLSTFFNLIPLFRNLKITGYRPTDGPTDGQTLLQRCMVEPKNPRKYFVSLRHVSHETCTGKNNR